MCVCTEGSTVPVVACGSLAHCEYGEQRVEVNTGIVVDAGSHVDLMSHSVESCLAVLSATHSARLAAGVEDVRIHVRDMLCNYGQLYFRSDWKLPVAYRAKVRLYMQLYKLLLRRSCEAASGAELSESESD